MGLSSGEVLEQFEIDHRIEGFEKFFLGSRRTARKRTVA